MATMVKQKCWCGKVFDARAADVARGWGKSCCKKHAAQAREKAARTVDHEQAKLIEQDRLHTAGMEGLPFDWSPF